nr:hypothetical protein GCM10020241_01900 [Streptoalloteichus tenebrarius]
MAVAARVKATMPGTSTRWPPGGLSASEVTARIRAATHSGSEARKIHRHPRRSASTPPATVPTAPPAPATVPHTAKALALAWPW